MPKQVPFYRNHHTETSIHPKHNKKKKKQKRGGKYGTSICLLEVLESETMALTKWGL